MRKQAYNSKDRDLPIVLDGRAMLVRKPIVLYEICGRSLLLHHLDTVWESHTQNSIVILVPTEWKLRIREHISHDQRFHRVEVKDRFNDKGILLPGNAVYIRRLLRKALRRGDFRFDHALLTCITRDADIQNAEDFLWRDEHLTIARYLNMPLARRLAFALKKIRVTPNQVTLAAGGFGVLAGVAMALGSYFWGLLAALLIQVSWTLDLTDGYLARLTDRSSKFGAWLDVVIDEVKNIAMYFGLAFGVFMRRGNLAWLGIGALWILCYHVAAVSFRYDQAFGSAQTLGGRKAVVAKTSFRERLYHCARYIFGASRSIDVLPQLFTIVLIAHLNMELLIFLSLINMISLIRLFQMRFSSHWRRERESGTKVK